MPAVYETIRVKEGAIPLLNRHVRRLEDNCRAVGLPMPEGVDDTIINARDPDRPNERLRVTWDGAELLVEHLELPPVDGLRVQTVSVPHGGYRVKTTDRAVFERAREEARAAGADEGLLLTTEGFVAEGTLFAVGWFSGSRLCLPSLELGILPSIGRSRVQEVARGLDYQVEEGRFLRSELDGKPVFGTTATRGIVKIAMLDGVPVPSDQRIDRLAAAFWPA